MSSSDAGAPAAPDSSSSVDYDRMLDLLDVGIHEAARKLGGDGRIRDEEKEKVRIKWVRALAYSVNVRRQVANDAELAELHERVEALEAGEAPEEVRR